MAAPDFFTVFELFVSIRVVFVDIVLGCGCLHSFDFLRFFEGIFHFFVDGVLDRARVGVFDLIAEVGDEEILLDFDAFIGGERYERCTVG